MFLNVSMIYYWGIIDNALLLLTDLIKYYASIGFPLFVYSDSLNELNIA